MPLLKRRPVPLLPLPEAIRDGTLPPDTEVFYLQATGEIFLDFEAYSQRIAFYLQKVFTCEATGRQGLDYYAAMNSELQETASIHARFPAALKPKILASAQYQVVSRFDALIDNLYERYKDRYFVGDVCTLDDSDNQKTLVRVTDIQPPQCVRDLLLLNPDYLARCEAAKTDPQKPAPEMIWTVSHQLACNLANPDAEVQKWDPADQYQYEVQPLHPDGTPADKPPSAVTPRQLSRDRLIWTKTFLKKFLKECMHREGGVAAPWVVKKRYALEFGVTMEEPEELKAKHAQQAQNGKRRKSGKGGKDLLDEPPAKRARSNSTSVLPPAGSDPNAPDEAAKGGRVRPTKFPAEDLYLDLVPARSKQAAAEERPVKPVLSRDLPVDIKDFPVFLHVWAMLNVFGWPLSISNFTLDQFAQALKHTAMTPHSELLIEVHGALLSIIGVDGYRLAGTVTATSTGVLPELPPCEPGTEEAAMSLEEKERYIRRGLKYARKWDRSKRLHVDKQRQGWAKHMIGCLCQRGGVDMLPQLPRILRDILGDYVTPEEARQSAKAAEAATETSSVQEPTSPAPAPTPPPPPPPPAADPDSEKDELEEEDELDESVQHQPIDDDEDAEDEGDVDALGPQERYLTLPPADKLAVLEFLCAIITSSKPYRRYIEECETSLTGLRKERTDINKERKALQAEKAALAQQGKEEEEGKPVIGNGTQAPSDAVSIAPSVQESSSRAPTPVPPAEPTSPLSPTSPPPPSDVDELDSDSEPTPSKKRKSTARQSGARETSAVAAQKGKKAAKPGTINGSKRSSRSKGAAPPPPEPPKPVVKDEAYYDQALEALRAVEEVNDREFRRHQNVVRIRPLGMDRFFVKYWYMDGVGSMELFDDDGTSAVYGTGMIIVQGPSEPDVTYSLSLAGMTEPEELRKRRAAEEGPAEASLETGQWALLTTEQELNQLVSWLNPKGQREAALRQSINNLKPYILAGMKKRAEDLHSVREPEELPPTKGRRKSNNKKPVYGPDRFYMNYVNEFAWANARKNRPKGW